MRSNATQPNRDEMARLLEAAGSAYDPEAVEALIDGVLAAPAEIGTGWHRLVTDPMPQQLAVCLEALRAAKAAEYHDGLSRDDFARQPRSERLARLRKELASRGSTASSCRAPTSIRENTCRPRPASRLAYRLHRVGRPGDRVARPRGAVCRWAVHIAGGRSDRYRLVRDPSPGRGAAGGWLAAALKGREVIGYDPWLHTPHEVERFRGAVEKAGASFAGSRTTRSTRFGPASRRRRSHLSCRIPSVSRARAPMKRLGWGVACPGGDRGGRPHTPESIAWLLNIRGGDVPHTPLPLWFAILRQDGSVSLFIDRRKLVPGLDAISVTRSPCAARALGPALDGLRPGRQDAGRSGERRLLGVRPARRGRREDPPRRRSLHVAQGVQERRRARRHPRGASARRRGADALPRLAGARGAKGGLREIAASDRLEAFRREGKYFRDLSFPTISGAGSNGAIVHYRASPETEKRLEPGTLYLLDSGAQYLDGTTDVTRTIAIGKPRRDARALHPRAEGPYRAGPARFPKGTTGSQLDGFARRALWQVGLDYDHGTGHGVGAISGCMRGRNASPRRRTRSRCCRA